MLHKRFANRPNSAILTHTSRHIAEKHAKLIKDKATELGFLACGISKADFLEEQAPLLEQWLHKNMQGQMSYMERNFDKRLDPRKLVDGARSVISVLFNYYPETLLNSDLKISKYAYGEDYHMVVKDKMRQLLEFMTENFGAIQARIFVDSAPVLDKVWAQKSGLGWMGKHTNLISKQNGSFFFIGEIICDLELAVDHEIKDYCGTCTKCIDACPTDAIVQPYVVDGSKCISYFTIELKDAIPDEVKEKFEGWVFGCDICQDVCPWNRFSKPHQEPRFQPSDVLEALSASDFIEITEEIFKEIFARSALKRTGYEGFKRNLKSIKS